MLPRSTWNRFHVQNPLSSREMKTYCIAAFSAPMEAEMTNSPRTSGGLAPERAVPDYATVQRYMQVGRQLRSAYILELLQRLFAPLTGRAAFRARRRADYAALVSMSDRELADIGISRSEIADVTLNGGTRERRPVVGNDAEAPKPRLVSGTTKAA